MNLTEQLITSRKYLRMCCYRVDAIERRRAHISATTGAEKAHLTKELEKAEAAAAAAEKEWTRVHAAFTRALEALEDPRAREILTYRYLYDLSPAGVMQALSLSHSSYYRHLDAALKEVNGQ